QIELEVADRTHLIVREFYQQLPVVISQQRFAIVVESGKKEDGFVAGHFWWHKVNQGTTLSSFVCDVDEPLQIRELRALKRRVDGVGAGTAGRSRAQRHDVIVSTGRALD